MSASRVDIAAMRTEMHAVAEEIDAFLTKENAPPIWWRCSDIAHTAAGCVWDDERGEDGSYDCEPIPETRCDSCGAAVQLAYSPPHGANFCRRCYRRENSGDVPAGGEQG